MQLSVPSHTPSPQNGQPEPPSAQVQVPQSCGHVEQSSAESQILSPHTPPLVVDPLEPDPELPEVEPLLALVPLELVVDAPLALELDVPDPPVAVLLNPDVADPVVLSGEPEPELETMPDELEPASGGPSSTVP